MAKKVSLLEVTMLGNPILRNETAEVTMIQAKELQRLIDNMITTVKKVHGVGIAAPQVNKSIRLVIIASNPNERYPHAPKMKPLPVINPKILFVSQTMTKGWEGCLSIPGIRGLVPRYDSLTVEYTTRTGKKKIQTFSGFVAKIFQHELDHIDGKVFLDRVEHTTDIISEKEYLKQMKSKLLKKQL